MRSFWPAAICWLAAAGELPLRSKWLENPIRAEDFADALWVESCAALRAVAWVTLRTQNHGEVASLVLLGSCESERCRK